ncbi:MAG: Npt1/Npt2 family nucleotide transporter [Desulfobacterales bacterium]
MRRVLLRWLRLYEEEIAVFLWTAALLFLMRSSGMILNNYAETAFLKRYGVEYLPIVNMLNSIATFAATGIIAAFMAKVSGNRLLTMLFVFCGISVGAIRFMIPMGYDLIYPLLFMFKSQFELLQAVLFWNLANDIFNTRQSKRIFPLITAGGVLGLIAGSFGTPYLSSALRFDNLLLVYLGVSLAGAVTVQAMSIQMRMHPSVEKKKKRVAQQPSMSEQIKNVLPMIRESALIKIVLVLTFMPNVVIPIMNYQFNYTADAYFASESGLLDFFSYFRGVLNIISLFLLLFVGRVYARFGLPVALMFHPANYMIAFIAFLLRFDIFSAVYARMSTNILRTTINMPANSILIGLFPESYRAFVRPFLRGTVVRAGLFTGSGLILISSNLFHPRYLSLVALPFVIAWVAAPLILKKNYASILMNLISRNLLDLKSLEEQNLGSLFKKEQAGGELVQAFLNAQGDDALWYARLLKTLDLRETDELILEAAQKQPMPTRMHLIEMLSESPGPGAAETLERMLHTQQDPRLKVALINAVKKTGAERAGIRNKLESLMMHPDPQVRGHAAGALYATAPGTVKPKIDAWLRSQSPEQRKAGVIAAGETLEAGYANQLESLLGKNENEPICEDILYALGKTDPPGLNDIAAGFLEHQDPRLRRAALNTLQVSDEAALKQAIRHLGDPDDSIAELAKEKILNAEYINGQVLIEALNRPNRRLRAAVFELLEKLRIKDLDLVRFTRQGLREAYTCLCKAAALEKLADSDCKSLLDEHLHSKKDLVLENVFRVLSIHDRTGQMRTVFKGLFSGTQRQRANSIELLGDVMDRKLFAMAEPLLEGRPASDTAEAGKKFFRLPVFDSVQDDLFPELLEKGDWLETIFALCIIGDHSELAEKHRAAAVRLKSSDSRHIRQMARKTAPGNSGTLDQKEQIMDTELNVADKILLLKNIAIFSGLSVSELGAIAAVTEEIDHGAESVVIQEGEAGDRVYLIIEGRVAVCKGRDPESEFRLDTMGTGDYFGEMALFEEAERSATIRTLEPSRFLVLDKQEFYELVREYPGIALQICTVLSHRLRHLHERLAEAGGISGPEGGDKCR